MKKSFNEVKEPGIRPLSEVVIVTRQVTVVQFSQALGTHSERFLMIGSQYKKYRKEFWGRDLKTEAS